MTIQQALFVHYLRNRLDFSYGRITQAFKQRYVAKQPFNIDLLDNYTFGSNFGRQLCIDASKKLEYNIDLNLLDDLL